MTSGYYWADMKRRYILLIIFQDKVKFLYSVATVMLTNDQSFLTTDMPSSFQQSSSTSVLESETVSSLSNHTMPTISELETRGDYSFDACKLIFSTKYI
jgi:hypothetical protein